MILPDVDSDKTYSRKLLKGEDDAFARGFEHAIDCVETWRNNRLFDLDADGTTRSKMDAEQLGEWASDLLEWLHSDRAAIVVSALENGNYPEEVGADDIDC